MLDSRQGREKEFPDGRVPTGKQNMIPDGGHRQERFKTLLTGGGRRG
jgi:hypothetical protein